MIPGEKVSLAGLTTEQMDREIDTAFDGAGGDEINELIEKSLADFKTGAIALSYRASVSSWSNAIATKHRGFRFAAMSISCNQRQASVARPRTLPRQRRHAQPRPLHAIVSHFL